MEGASGDDRSESGFVFIDETWAKTNMTRTHRPVRARGQRLVAKAPLGRWRTLTFLAALRCDGLTAPCVIDGLDPVGLA